MSKVKSARQALAREVIKARHWTWRKVRGRVSWAEVTRERRRLDAKLKSFERALRS